MGPTVELAEAAARTRTGARAWGPPFLFALVLGLLVGILVDSVPAGDREPESDDGYYVSYMHAVAREGPSAFPGMFARWNATPQDWIFPPPSRVGYVAIAGAWGRAFGTTYRSLQLLSLTAFVLLCVVNYAFARRHFGETRGLLIGVLLAFSPLLTGLSRLVLTDSLAALLMTTAAWTFLEVVRDPRSRVWSAAFAAAAGAMVLVKELAVLLVFPLGAFLAYERFVRGVPHDLRRTARDLAVAGAVVLVLLVAAAGGPGPLLETFRHVLESPGTNRYAIRLGSGPWFRVVLDYLLMSPWPTVLAIGWFWITAARLRAGRYDRESVYFAFLIAGTVLLLSFFTKNVRYAVVLALPIAVFAVLLVWDLLRGLAARRRAAAASAIVAILCFLDWRSFDLIWVEHHGYDPVTRFLALVRRVIPGLDP